MAISPNVLAGLAAALGGGMKAYNVQRDADEETRQFNVEQDRQQKLLARMIARDELDEFKTQEDVYDKQFDRAMTTAQQFGGQRLPESAVNGMPESLRDLISKPAMSLESRQISGQLGGPVAGGDAGGINFTKRAAAPIAGQVDINMPESEKARIAQGNQLAAFQRAQLMAGGREADRDQRQQNFLMGLTQNQQQHQDRIAATMAGIAARGAGRDSMTSGQEFNAINKLNQVYNTNTKAAREIERQFGLMDSAMNDINTGKAKDLNATSQAILVTFQKILDPESVVRESEYARSPQGQAMIEALKGYVNRISQGGPGVTPQSLQEFHRVAQTFRDRSMQSLNAERARVEAHAKRFNLPMELVVADYDGNAPTPTNAPAPAASAVAPAKKKFEILSVK